MPFTRDEFFRVFAEYNLDVWPAQVVLIALALAATAAAFARAHRFASFSLAVLFAWSAVAYHWTHFAAVTPAARVFAALFLFGSIAFVVTRTDFMTGGPTRVAIGSAFVTYALLGYPAIGFLLGHRYPAMPTFGAPCPVAIFALGLLITAKPPVHRIVWIAPLLWAALATVAAFRFGMLEDLALPAAALTLLTLGIPRHIKPFAITNQ